MQKSTRQTCVKSLHAQRCQIKQRILEQSALHRNRVRQAELRNSREESGRRSDSISDGYAFIGAEFQCDLRDPAVIDLLLGIEEEIRNEQLVSLFEDSQNEDWETYYHHLL